MRTALLSLLVASLAQAGNFEYRAETRTTPRSLRIHVLTADLTKCDLAVAVGADPDGNGPAEAQLAMPARLADGFAAAVNANAWGMLPPTPKGERPNYVVGGACDVAGWVVNSGRQVSPPTKGNWSFWLDATGQPHIGHITTAQVARAAVAGFGGLLQAGKILPKPNETRHPRTALGLAGSQLTLVVVDGRQPGYSEGLSEFELATLMQELGCTDALNLDGGGSSVMVINGAIVNRPSDNRPVPVMLGIRTK